MLHPDGRVIDSGGIVEADPQRRLVIRWKNPMNPEFMAEGDSLCTIELEFMDEAVKLPPCTRSSVRHSGSSAQRRISGRGSCATSSHAPRPVLPC
jgi:uncharacterized protein YndB with AHSA1/START domain